MLVNQLGFLDCVLGILDSRMELKLGRTIEAAFISRIQCIQVILTTPPYLDAIGRFGYGQERYGRSFRLIE